MINIFGNQVEGTIVNELENIVIVEDHRKLRHVVHKKTLMKNFKSKKKTYAENSIAGRFDLDECMQTHKRPETGRYNWVDTI